MLISGALYAENIHSGSVQSSAYLARIQAHTPLELTEILTRLDTLLQQEQGYPSSQPLALVLHGEEAKAFLRENYGEHRELVDMAARLDAFNAVDIQICETWLRTESIPKSQLPAFVDTVPYGPDQEEALIEQGYEYF
jgi:intracellular sulfur oxidation DsrE/DsrF family protein